MLNTESRAPLQVDDPFDRIFCWAPSGQNPWFSFIIFSKSDIFPTSNLAGLVLSRCALKVWIKYHTNYDTITVQTCTILASFDTLHKLFSTLGLFSPFFDDHNRELSFRKSSWNDHKCNSLVWKIFFIWFHKVNAKFKK